tara:strand:+ start:757 stop:1395 length:639 start_codon:yes stop_codon:yes gene_type:complete
MTTQLRDLTLNEISGVDHPASLVEGWLVTKSDSDPITASLVGALTQPEGTAPVSTLTPEAPAVPDAPEVDDAVAKALVDINKELAAAREERDVLKADRDSLAETAAVEKADATVATWSHVPGMSDEFSPVLRSLSDEQRTALVSIFDAVEIAVAAADGIITKELGGDADGDANDIEAIAKALVADGTHPNFHVAIAAVAEANPDLYAASKEA